MTVRLGDIAPDFTAPTTQGEINFHEWLGDSWGVLFSHPKDFTPVCTTELGYVAKIKPEFDKRNVKVIGLSVDPVESHVQWEGDIEETQGTAVNFPMIGDPERTVADLYDMIHENASDTLTVRSVFVIGPDKKVKLTLTYPASTGRNFDEILRVIDSLQLTADYKVATPANWKDGEDVIIVPGRLRRRRQGALPRRLEPGQALPPRHQTAQPLTPPESPPEIRSEPVRLDPGANLGGEAIEVIGRALADLRRRDRDGHTISIDDDMGGIEPRRQLHDIGVRREHGMRAVLMGPVIAEQRHPSLPQLFVVEVGAETMTNLDHGDVGMQITQPRGSQRARRSVTLRRAVHEHHQAVAARGCPLDHVRVTEMRRVETTDDQPGRMAFGRGAHAGSTATSSGRWSATAANPSSARRHPGPK